MLSKPEIMHMLWAWVAGLPTVVGALVGAILATMGWIYAARRQRLLSRKQHTFNALLQASFNGHYNKAVDALRPYLRKELSLDLKNPENSDTQNKLRFLLNHYEFLAAGIRNGDICERLLRDSERGTILSLIEFSYEFIGQTRDTRSRKTTFEHLEWLYERWKANPPNIIHKILERLIAKPLYKEHYFWFYTVAILFAVITMFGIFAHVPSYNDEKDQAIDDKRPSILKSEHRPSDLAQWY